MQGSILVSDVVENTFAKELERAAPGRPRIVLRAEGLDGDIGQVEIAFFSGDLYPGRARPFWLNLFKAESLKWLHSFSAGVDHPVFQSMGQKGVRLTTSSGASAVPIAHTVMLYILAFSRDLRGWTEEQQRREWKPRNVRDLQGQVLGVVGLGPIGREVARLGAAFRMRVIGIRRTPRGDEPCETWSFDRLPELLGLADYLVLALPLTESTRHILDAAALERMRSEAVIVNVGRGDLVDEPALIEALAKQRIAGAALDVFEVEPLPAESPLWGFSNVIVTPHCAGDNPGNDARSTEMFIENLARYERGEALRNEVVTVDSP